MASRILSYIVLVLLACFFLFPVVLGALNSIKTEGEMLNSVLSIPLSPYWQNYRNAIFEVELWNNFKNNIIVTSVGVTGIILFSSMAGYKLSRTPGKLSKAIFFFMWVSMLIPFYSIMFSLIRVAKMLHIKNLLIGLPLIYIGLGVNFAIFLYHGFVKSVPLELEEAALMDGCGQFQIFFRIVFPLLTPITVTITILDVLWLWNDFLLPLVMISKYQNYTLVLVASSFIGMYKTKWDYILPILMLTSIPVIIFYLAFQKYIVKGIADGAVKG
jgi:raffinose/stachyose/melibiose transport system permease protein